MAHDMELVEDDPSIRGIFQYRIPEWLPHVHGRQFDVSALFLAQRLEEQVDVSLFTALTTDPNGAPPIQVTDDDPVVMPLANGDLINTDSTGCGQSRQVNLLLHVELIEIFHRAVVQAFHLGDRLVRHIPAQLAHMHRKALRIARVLCQPVKMLYMHADTPRTIDTPTFELHVNPPSSNRQIAYPQDFLVVTPPATVTTV